MAIKEKKCNVVLLPSEKSSRIVKKGQIYLFDKKLTFISKQFASGHSMEIGSSVLQHLYITSDEEIKEGDWITDGKIIHKVKVLIDGYINLYKIIATTDTSLGLPKPSEGFIKKFIAEWNKGNIITEVMVEYEYRRLSSIQEAGGIVEGNMPKINKSNEITVHPVKSCWTKEEVISLCREAFEDSCKYINFKDFIKQNL